MRLSAGSQKWCTQYTSSVEYLIGSHLPFVFYGITDVSSSRAEAIGLEPQPHDDVLHAEADVELAVERLAQMLNRRLAKRAHQGHFANFLIG